MADNNPADETKALTAMMYGSPRHARSALYVTTNVGSRTVERFDGVTLRMDAQVNIVKQLMSLLDL